MKAKTAILISAVVLALIGIGYYFATRDNPAADRPVSPAPVTVRPTIPTRPLAASVEPKMIPVTPPAVTNPPPVNAADLYRQAFAALDALSAEEQGWLSDWKTNAVPPELCAKLRPITDLAHQAGTNCNWGVKFEGFETKLPHLSQARQLARALVWNAARCRQDDSAGAGEDLLAALGLGQNISGEFLIGHLVNTAVHGITLGYLAENAQSLSATTLAALAATFNDSSYDELFYRAMESEAKGVEFEADRFAASTNDVAALVRALGSEGGSLANLSKEQVVAKMREVAALEREYIQAIGFTDAEYQAWLAKLEAAQQSNPLIDTLMPAFDNVVDKTRAMVVQRAMTAAGLQVLVAGPSVLTQHLDPASGQPFQYQPTATGFELISNYNSKGQPVTMNFRQ